MQVDGFVIEPGALDSLVIETVENLKKNTGRSDLLGHGLGVVWRRLQRNGMARYRDYGPFWFALKDELRRAGYPVGDETDPVIAARYRGSSGAHTLMAADTFRLYSLSTYAVGTNRFDLDGDGGEAFMLFDRDMEEAVSA